MKLLLILLCLSTAMCYPQKSNDGWVTIYYVLNPQGIEVAKRFSDTGKWVISDPATALEKMYQEKVKAETKYELAVEILKNLDGQGNIKDKRAYFEAVSRFNQFK